MRPSLAEFERSLGELRDFIRRNELEQLLARFDATDVAPTELRDLLADYQRVIQPYSLRLVQYSSQVVLLYGSFERFLESLLSAVAESINHLVPEFESLPERIRENHRQVALEALRDQTWLGRQDDPRLASQIIHDLYSCENPQNSYRLNPAIYARHRGNFARQTIDETFRRLAVEDFVLLVSRNDAFKKAVADIPDPFESPTDPLGLIDTLVQRRNEIAHGSPGELLTGDQVEVYLDVLGAFAKGAYDALRIWLACFILANHSHRLGSVRAVHYRKVAEFESSSLREGTSLNVGDYVLVTDSALAPYAISEVLNIRLHSGDTKTWRTELGSPFCLELRIDRLKRGSVCHLVSQSNQTIQGLCLPYRYEDGTATC